MRTLLTVGSRSAWDFFSFSSLFFFFSGDSMACMNNLSLCRHPPCGVSHICYWSTDMTFSLLFIPIGSVTVNSESDKKIKKRSVQEQHVIPASSSLPQLCAPLGGVAGQHGHRAPDSSNAQHLSSWQWCLPPWPNRFSVINHNSGRMLSQDHPEIRSVH